MTGTARFSAQPAQLQPPAEQRFRPVTVWAVVGVAFLVVQVIAYAGWVFSGDVKSIPPGHDSAPTYMVVTSNFLQIVGLPLAILIIYLWILRPWRRKGHIDLKGWMLIAGVTLWWQDVGVNWFAPAIRYNSMYVNRGSWFSHIPGWFSPGGSMQPIALLGTAPLYFTAVLAPVVLFSFMMGKAKSRWPQLTRTQLTVGVFGCGVVAIFVVEWGVTVYLAGAYTWAGTIGWLTLFHGHYYQYPIYELVLWPAVWTAWTCMYHYRNDRGQMAVERGVDQIQVGAKSKRALRLLALIGYINAIMFAWSIAMSMISLYQDPWPKDVTDRSYFIQGFCGPGTAYPTCPPKYPYPRQ